MNWRFVQILMYSKFHSKLRVLDTDDVKQKTSLFSVQGKSAWYCFKAVALLFYVICVRYTKQMPKVPSEPSSPLIYSMNWLWMQSTEWTDLIGNPISACRLISGNNISLAWWNMFNFGEYAEIRRPPSTSLKESNFPGLILKFPDSTNCPLRGKQLIFLAL